MKLSQLFTKTRKDVPAGEVSINAQLLIRAGFIDKELAGAYNYLPLGLRVLRKIEGIIREEMNAVGGQEVLLTTLQDPELWARTNRWDDRVVDNWFKTTLASGAPLGLATTHEEPLTNLLRRFARSHKDFPLYIYQFQTKFRNELRAKSGLMRGREFLMKDLYSFCRSQEEHNAFYKQMKQAYTNIFNRVGIGEQTYFTYASGGSFSEASDEFQTLAPTGEDTIYLDKSKKLAVNKEMLKPEVLKKLGLKKADLVEHSAIEVGNIFPLGTKFSDALGLNFSDEAGKVSPVIMGSYGIGLGRLMGTIAEISHDDKGLIWPASVAPAQVHLVALGEDPEVIKAAELEYKKLQTNGVEVLFDDRAVSAGAKLNDADLLGLPLRVLISTKTLSNQTAEVKARTQPEVYLVELDKLVGYLTQQIAK